MLKKAKNVENFIPSSQIHTIVSKWIRKTRANSEVLYTIVKHKTNKHGQNKEIYSYFCKKK